MNLTLYHVLLLGIYDLFREKLRRKLPLLFSFSKSVKVYEWDKAYESMDVYPEIIDKYSIIEELTLEGYFSLEDRDRLITKLRSKYPNAWRAEGYALMWLNAVTFRKFPPESFYILHELLHLYYGVGDEIVTSLCVDRLAYLLIGEFVPVGDEEAQSFLDFVVVLSKKAYREPEKMKRITKGEDPKRWIKSGCLWDHDRLVRLWKKVKAVKNPGPFRRQGVRVGAPRRATGFELAESRPQQQGRGVGLHSPIIK